MPLDVHGIGCHRSPIADNSKKPAFYIGSGVGFFDRVIVGLFGGTAEVNKLVWFKGGTSSGSVQSYNYISFTSSDIKRVDT